MTGYEVAKLIHVGCVVLSGTGFIVRFLLLLRESGLLRTRIMRVVPHVVDTCLLAAAIAMLIILRVDPLQVEWLSAKVFGLAAYIATGMIAMRIARPGPVRLIAFGGALACFGYVIAVALTKNPVPFAAPIIS